MVSLTGPGFDSPQLHIKQKADTPKGVFVFTETVESLLSKGICKNKKTMRSMVSAFYLQN
jgi:hypothetical protein